MSLMTIHYAEDIFNRGRSFETAPVPVKVLVLTKLSVFYIGAKAASIG